MPPTDNQIEGCHGHYVSINAGGKWHSYGDSCGCDGINPKTNIDFIAPLLILSAFIIIVKQKKLKELLEEYFINHSLNEPQKPQLDIGAVISRFSSQISNKWT